MPGLREEIRAILREEFAALRSATQGAAQGPSVECVRVESGADLTRFAQELLRRSADPVFAERVARGDLVFRLDTSAPGTGPIVTGPVRRAPDRLDKSLITERDIAALDGSARSLRIAPASRLTPLARDEARRRGIRIEREKT